MLVFFGMLGWALLTAMNQPKLGLAMLFGVGFGLLIERAHRFTSAFRDMRTTVCTHMAKAIIIGMAVSAIGIFSYVQLGVEPKIMWAGPNAVIGGFSLVWFWHRAGRRLLMLLDVPRGRRPGALLVGRSGQRDRLNDSGVLLG